MKLLPKFKMKMLVAGMLLSNAVIGAYCTAGALPEVSEARAAESAAEVQPQAVIESPDEAYRAATSAEAPPVQAEDIKAVMETLEKKRLSLQEEEARLKQERAGLERLKQEIEYKIEELSGIQQKIEADLNQKVALASQAEQKKNLAEEKNIKQLVKVYASMKPKSAAEIVDKMDLTVVLQVFSHMKGEQVGQILGYVDKDRAAKISEWLAKKKTD